jgi:hypothetical protein
MFSWIYISLRIHEKMLENLGLITLVPFGLQTSTIHNLFVHLIIEFKKINNVSEMWSDTCSLNRICGA